MKTGMRGHPICREEVCDVEITPEQKYCAAHNFFIDRWLAKSRAALEVYKALAKAEEK